MIVNADNPELAGILAGVLRDGGIAIAPCDTMYGLIGEAPGSDSRIRAAKGRVEDKAFLRLIPELSWVSRLTDFRIPEALLKYWPGPLTMVIPLRSGGTAAVRVPDSPFLCLLMQELDKPIYSTSVNQAGSPPLWRFDEIRRVFEHEVELLVDAGDMPGGVPSTIVDLSSTPHRVLRQGALNIPPQELA